ncbi:hypothetical protein ACVISU_004232 [Bradyrhizobium sp. USDA 4452]
MAVALAGQHDRDVFRRETMTRFAMGPLRSADADADVHRKFFCRGLHFLSRELTRLVFHLTAADQTRAGIPADRPLRHQAPVECLWRQLVPTGAMSSIHASTRRSCSFFLVGVDICERFDPGRPVRVLLAIRFEAHLFREAQVEVFDGGAGLHPRLNRGNIVRCQVHARATLTPGILVPPWLHDPSVLWRHCVAVVAVRLNHRIAP